MFWVRPKIFGLGLEPEFWIALKCEIDLSAYHNIKYFDWPGFWGFLS